MYSDNVKNIFRVRILLLRFQRRGKEQQTRFSGSHREEASGGVTYSLFRIKYRRGSRWVTGLLLWITQRGGCRWRKILAFPEKTEKRLQVG
jgi:hypothetical protein